jgi:hypothetical protein
MTALPTLPPRTQDWGTIRCSRGDYVVDPSMLEISRKDLSGLDAGESQPYGFLQSTDASARFILAQITQRHTQLDISRCPALGDQGLIALLEGLSAQPDPQMALYDPG